MYLVFEITFLKIKMYYLHYRYIGFIVQRILLYRYLHYRYIDISITYKNCASLIYRRVLFRHMNCTLYYYSSHATSLNHTHFLSTINSSITPHSRLHTHCVCECCRRNFVFLISYAYSLTRRSVYCAEVDGRCSKFGEAEI